jgi:hypothetical protein
MKHTLSQKTPVVYMDGHWTHKRGPVGRIERESKPVMKAYVNTRRYNAIVMARKLRAASFVAAPILRKQPKQFENNPQ